MRLMVMFDLPTVSEEERQRANRFRRLLIKNGFYRVQFSVYARLCRGQDNVDKFKKRIKQNIPSYGNIRMMQVTEKQFDRMEILLGNIEKSEKFKENQLVLF